VSQRVQHTWTARIPPQAACTPRRRAWRALRGAASCPRASAPLCLNLHAHLR
jgi:hypothetical protein